MNDEKKEKKRKKRKKRKEKKKREEIGKVRNGERDYRGWEGEGKTVGDADLFENISLIFFLNYG